MEQAQQHHRYWLVGATEFDWRSNWGFDWVTATSKLEKALFDEMRKRQFDNVFPPRAFRGVNKE